MLMRKIVIILLGLVLAAVIVIADNHAHKVNCRDQVFSLPSS
jgi:hypothetical protein